MAKKCDFVTYYLFTLTFNYYLAYSVQEFIEICEKIFL